MIALRACCDTQNAALVSKDDRFGRCSMVVLYKIVVCSVQSAIASRHCQALKCRSDTGLIAPPPGNCKSPANFGLWVSSAPLLHRASRPSQASDKLKSFTELTCRLPSCNNRQWLLHHDNEGCRIRTEAIAFRLDSCSIE